MMRSSVEYLNFGLLFPAAIIIDAARVRGQILPIYIIRARVPSPREVIPFAAPSDNPVVLNAAPAADGRSRKAGFEVGWGVPGVSATCSTSTAIVSVEIPMKTSPVARCIVVSGVVLLKACVVVSRLSLAYASATKTARVVVLSPPAVEPGDPPIIMRSMVRVIDAVLRSL